MAWSTYSSRSTSFIKSASACQLRYYIVKYVKQVLPSRVTSDSPIHCSQMHSCRIWHLLDSTAAMRVQKITSNRTMLRGGGCSLSGGLLTLPELASGGSSVFYPLAKKHSYSIDLRHPQLVQKHHHILSTAETAVSNAKHIGHRTVQPFTLFCPKKTTF